MATNVIVDLVLNNVKAYVAKIIVDCSIAINDGRIFKIGKETNMPSTDLKIDLKNLLVLPGLIDVHVHLRDEGKAYKEDFYSGTASAAAGGITSVLDMPNNDPVTMSVETVRNRMRIAEKRILVNAGFYSEFPRNLKEIEGIVKEGVIGFKLFMTDQIGGLDIDNDRALLEAFRLVGKSGATIAVHAEDRTSLKKVENELKRANHNDVVAFLQAHSDLVEVKAIERMVNVARQTKTHLHFCHISSEGGLDKVVDGKTSGLSITCEATPHHLLLSTDDLRRMGPLAVTMPPVRGKHHITALWNGVKAGWIDVLASDHAPHTLEEKETEVIWDAKVGILGLETILPMLLTEVHRGRLTIGDIVRMMSENPAKIFRLNGRGFLKEGNTADLTVVDLNKKQRIDPYEFHSKAKFSPFAGYEIVGKPVRTFVGGQLVMDYSEIVARPGSGQLIRRA